MKGTRPLNNTGVEGDQVVSILCCIASILKTECEDL